MYPLVFLSKPKLRFARERVTFVQDDLHQLGGRERTPRRHATFDGLVRIAVGGPDLGLEAIRSEEHPPDLISRAGEGFEHRPVGKFGVRTRSAARSAVAGTALTGVDLGASCERAEFLGGRWIERERVDDGPDGK